MSLPHFKGKGFLSLGSSLLSYSYDR